MNPPEPVIVKGLFSETQAALMELLRGLSAEDWQKETVCAGWTVKDVALHLLGGEIGNLSRRRDRVTGGAAIRSWEELVAFLKDWNQGWVSAARRMSPSVIIDIYQLIGRQMIDYFESLDPFALGGPVNWAGPEPAPVWLDLAREYTERWHHQQHIRDAVGRPGLKEPRYLAPVLAAFVRALPRTYQSAAAPDGATLTLTIHGASGGHWTILREDQRWTLFSGAPVKPTAEVQIDQDLAWRLFTRSIPEDRAQAQMRFEGDPDLGRRLLGMVAIIA